MKIEYVLRTKSESEEIVQLFLEERCRKATVEEFGGGGEGDGVPVSSKLDLLWRRGNRDFEAARALPVGHRFVLEF